VPDFVKKLLHQRAGVTYSKQGNENNLRLVDSCENGNEPSGSTKGREFLD
jgi:hypothetical protein